MGALLASMTLLLYGVGVVIVLMGVTFLSAAINWEGGKAIIYFGVANALVITSLILATKPIGIRKSDLNE